MSFNDPEVQPEDGQGQESQDAPYSEYLNRIPEELRGDVEPIFREWDANVTRMRQDDVAQRQSWQPYEQIGVNKFSPEDVQWALQFRQAVEDPQAIKEWYESYARDQGLIQQQPQEQESFSYDEYDPNAQMQKLLQEQLGPISQQLEQLSSWRQQQESARAEAEAEQYIDQQIADLRSKHGDEVKRELLDGFVAKYIESDPQNAVPRAWADYEALRNQIQKETLQSKVDAPAPAESGGVPNSVPDTDNSLKTANQRALEILRSERRF